MLERAGKSRASDMEKVGHDVIKPIIHMCHGQGLSRFFWDKLIPPLIGNPYNGYINPYYWVDDHPLLYGNNGSLDPSTYHSHYPDHLRCRL